MNKKNVERKFVPRGRLSERLDPLLLLHNNSALVFLQRTALWQFLGLLPCLVYISVLTCCSSWVCSLCRSSRGHSSPVVSGARVPLSSLSQALLPVYKVRVPTIRCSPWVCSPFGFYQSGLLFINERDRGGQSSESCGAHASTINRASAHHMTLANLPVSVVSIPQNVFKKFL